MRRKLEKPSMSTATPSTTRILLVDDVPMFRELGSIFLARSGPVDLAECAADAFRCAEKRPPTIVIADMHLPDLPGTELCRLFKTEPARRAPRVVLLARPDSPRDHAAAVRAGADEVLFKPLERDTLIASVRRLSDFNSPRGLPRARLEQPVEITARGQRVEGTARNVSRGGIFVKAPLQLTRSEEVGLHFRLDGQGGVVAPTAQVVWSGASEDGADCAGMRFLEIDAQTIEKLDHYVSDHYPRTPSVPG
jgi:DNA-binding response OmpR family regulator